MTPLLNQRYEVLKPLGSGGFGETFLARDTQMPSGRYCVIKQLRPLDDDPQTYALVRDRFAREAAVLEALSQRCDRVPQLYAYFAEGDRFYLVQEWIQGDTLGQRFGRNGLFRPEAVRQLLLRFLPTLDEIHRCGIIHRDLKPDNIILQTPDDWPVPIDFGAVRESMAATAIAASGPSQPAQAPRSSPHSSPQISSIVIGTPGFMPPEQAAGRPTFASDLYALGLTALYLLTGRLPEDWPTDPHTGELQWQAPALPPDLHQAIAQAIRPYPPQRFASAREMLAALQGGAPNGGAPGAMPVSGQPTAAIAPGVHPTPPPTQGSFPPATAATVAVSPPAPLPHRPDPPSPVPLVQPPAPPQRRGRGQVFQGNAPARSQRSGCGGALSGMFLLTCLATGAVIGTGVVVAQWVARWDPPTWAEIWDGIWAKVQPELPEPPKLELPELPDMPDMPELPERPKLPDVFPPTDRETPTPTAQSFYFLADSAYRDAANADRRVADLRSQGFGEAGRFWIPDYANLSGQPYFQVYSAQFTERDRCLTQLRRYGQEVPDAYCALASGDRNVNADRVPAAELLEQGRSLLDRLLGDQRSADSSGQRPDPAASGTPATSGDRRPTSDPTTGITSYYNLINRGDYAAGWERLTPRFRREHSRNSYDSYTNWWEQVEAVEIVESQTPTQGDDAATVQVRLIYRMKTGPNATETQRYRLVWDRDRALWLFDDVL